MNGTTRLAPRALRQITRRAALSVSGSVEHTSGLTRLTGRSYPLVEVSHSGSAVRCEVHVAAQWPIALAAFAAAVRDTVRAVLRAHTGADSVVVDVHVGAVVSGPVLLPEVAVPLVAPTAAPELPAAAVPVPRPALRPVTTPPPPVIRRIAAPAPPVPRSPARPLR